MYLKDLEFEDNILMYIIRGVRSVFLFNVIKDVFKFLVDVKMFVFFMNKVIVVVIRVLRSYWKFGEIELK